MDVRVVICTGPHSKIWNSARAGYNAHMPALQRETAHNMKRSNTKGEKKKKKWKNEKYIVNVCPCPAQQNISVDSIFEPFLLFKS